MEFGSPQWTEGHFKRAAAQDDLGLESVGASQLRRFLPGLIAVTPNAGYYSYYSYLLWKWQTRSESVKRIDFKPFYRRQEAAYAVGCALHAHRGPLIGINGSIEANQIANAGPATVSLQSLSDRYMQSTYGGYGLFYRGTLEDLRLTRMGAPGYVDRPTEVGEELADAFARTFEATTYFKKYFEVDDVPIEALAELGEASCLCTIPDRSDHQALLNAFFGDPLDDQTWEAYRRTRNESLSLFLEFHDQRPEGASGTLGLWRRALTSFRFGQVPWTTSFAERRNSWRAYQMREVEVIGLLALWSVYLILLEKHEPVSHRELRQLLPEAVDWEEAGINESETVLEAVESATSQLPTDDDLMGEAEGLTTVSPDNLASAAARAFRLLLRVQTEAERDDQGYAELVNDGAEGRWSLRHLHQWTAARVNQPASEVLMELLDELHAQHSRVALRKVSGTDFRDPFCFSEDEGLLRLIRMDEPFWTDGRFPLVNHLLWTLDLIESPDGDARLTALGRQTLEKAAGGQAA